MTMVDHMYGMQHGAFIAAMQRYYNTHTHTRTRTCTRSPAQYDIRSVLYTHAAAVDVLRYTHTHTRSIERP